MALEVHYEVFRRQGSKGGWMMHDVVIQRDAALRLAEELMAGEKATGVKVVKETYYPDSGDYLSLKIFEDGHTRHKMEVAQEDVPHALPCFQPDDLYSYHARATIARLLSDFLTRHKLTVTELIHRADALEKLEATGTIYQHAIQKIAIAQASATTTPVQHIIKSLNDLVTRAVNRVYRDVRRGAFPVALAGQFGVLATRLAVLPDASYLFNGAAARHLAGTKSWNEKLSSLLGILQEAPEDEAGRALLLGAVDSLIAELLNRSAALHELLGETENLGAALIMLVDLFHAGAGADAADDTPLHILKKHFAKDGLPESRMAIASRITAELKSVRRLCPASLKEELKLLRRIANKLVLGQGKYLSHEDIIAAFTLRSRRLVAHESVGEHLAEAATPDEKLERVLLIEENIVGAENKRQLAGFALPIITSASFETHFLTSKSPPLVRLKRLAELQLHIRRSGFPDAQREELANLLDKIALELEARAKLFETIEEKLGNGVEKAIALLRLCMTGVLTEGKLSARARALILSHLGRPGFFTGYVAHVSAGAPDAEAAMAELMHALEKAGITPETGLKSIAA